MKIHFRHNEAADIFVALKNFDPRILDSGEVGGRGGGGGVGGVTNLSCGSRVYPEGTYQG